MIVIEINQNSQLFKIISSIWFWNIHKWKLSYSDRRIFRKYSGHSNMVCTCWCLHSHTHVLQVNPTNMCCFYCSYRNWYATSKSLSLHPHLFSILIQLLLFMSSTVSSHIKYQLWVNSCATFMVTLLVVTKRYVNDIIPFY